MRSLTLAFATILGLGTLFCLTPITTPQNSRTSRPAAHAVSKQIDNTVKSINRTLPQLKKTEKELTGTDEGGYLIVWRNATGVVKVIEWLGLSNNNLQTVYYFHNRRLICAKQERQYFLLNETTGNLDRRKPGHRTTATYYFQNRRLVQYVGEGKGQAAASILKDAAWALRLAAAPGKSLHLHDF